MTDYTPTTEIVRSGYYYSEVVDASGPTDDGEIYASFDRWLAEHDRQTAEKAWYEGMEAGQKAIVTRAFTPNNPYEKETNA